MLLSDGYTDLPAGKLANVVTCLEMREPPRPRPQPADLPGTVKRVERPETEWYRRVFRLIGEPYLWFSRLALDDDALAAIVSDPRVAIYVLENNAEVTGFLELDFRTAGECEIVFFGLVDSAIGSGNGRRLMNVAIATAWSRAIERLWVHTCTLDHPGAVAFYRRSGFVPFKRQIELCDDPRSLGLLAPTAAPHVPLL